MQGAVLPLTVPTHSAGDLASRLCVNVVYASRKGLETVFSNTAICEWWDCKFAIF